MRFSLMEVSLLVTTILVKFVLTSNATNSTNQSHVIELTDKNFEEFLSKNENVLVEFYTEWCGSCKKFKPTYEQLANIVKQQGLKLVVARIEVDKNPKAEKKFPVDNYPTIYFTRKYENIRFEGEKTISRLLDFIKLEMTEEAEDIFVRDIAELASMIAENKFQKKHIIFFLGSATKKSVGEYKSLKRIVSKFHPDTVLIHSNSSGFRAHLGLKEKIDEFEMVLLKYSPKKDAYNHGERLYILKRDFKDKTVQDKIKLALGKFNLQTLSDQAFDFILDKGLSSLIVVFKDFKDQNKIKEVSDVIRKINKHNKALFFNYKADLSDKNTKMLLDVMKLKSKTYPIVLILEGASDEVNKFVHTGNITYEEVNKFYENYKGKALVNHIGSEPLPKQPANKFGVLNLVGKTFQKKVVDLIGKEFLILFCSFSHKDCIIAQDRFNRVAQKFKGSAITFGYIDPTNNEINEVYVKSLPYVVLFHDKNSKEDEEKQITAFKGNFTTQALSEFIMKTSKKNPKELELNNQTLIYTEEDAKQISKRALEDEELQLGEFFKGKGEHGDDDLDLSSLMAGLGDSQQDDDDLDDHHEEHGKSATQTKGQQKTQQEQPAKTEESKIDL